MTPTAVATTETELLNPVSSTPPGFDPARDLSAGFMEFFLPLHRTFTSRQQALALKRVDSCGNEWSHHEMGVANILACLRGELSYYDKKRDRTVTIQQNGTVIFTRPRGLHLNQAGLIPDELVSASLFDVARIFYGINAEELKHPLCIYIPKSESAEEALWWRDLFQALAQWRGLPHNYIKCMALVESHPLAFQMEEFAYHLRDHIIGLNLGRWDYMASLIHFN